MNEVPPIPESQQPASPQPPVVMASLAKPKNKKRKICIIILCVVAFCIFCYIVDECTTDEETSPSAQQSQIAQPGIPEATILDRTVSTASAIDALKQTLGELNNQYGHTLKIRGCFGSDDNRQADAVFCLTKDGQLQSGLIRATTDANRKCRVLVQIAPPGKMADVIAKNALPQTKQTANAPAKSQPLTPHQFPDGSGSINLPANWRITEANKGAVVATGQNGDIVELGIYTQVFTQPSVGGAPPVMVPWGPAKLMFPDATQDFWNFLSRTGGPRRKFKQIVETQSLENQPNIQKMLLVYDWEMNENTYRSLALFIAQQTSQVSWMYYTSTVSAPETQFTRDLPTLLAIWGSRQVDPGVTTERLRDAAAKMRSCGEIIQDVNANRQRAFDRANDDWTEYFRGTTHVRDALAGETREVDDTGMNKMVDAYNRNEGYDRYKVIPLRDLNNE